MRAAELTSERELDCRGMQCPEPIMKLTGTVGTLGGRPGLIRVQADDPAFSADLHAWARATKAKIASERQDGAVLRALVLVNGAEVPPNGTALEPSALAPPAPPALAPLSARGPRPSTQPGAGAAEQIELDLRGKQCPVPVMELAKAARKTAGAPAVIRILADDPAFPKDLEAWCRSAKATPGEAREHDGVYDVTVLLGGATPASVSVSGPLPGPAAHSASAPLPSAARPREPSVSFVA
ncbi:MAG: sulfurtransferase TusA family protein, partial [Deltaproteobacteria bacterium]